MHQSASFFRINNMGLHKQPIFEKENSLPAGLLQKVLLRLEAESRLRSLRRRFALAAAVFLAILGLAVPVLRSFWLDLSGSGFTQYLSLFFYDFKSVMGNWQDYSLSLLESLPVFKAALSLGVVLGLLFWAKFVVRYGKGVLAGLHDFSLIHKI